MKTFLDQSNQVREVPAGLDLTTISAITQKKTNCVMHGRSGCNCSIEQQEEYVKIINLIDISPPAAPTDPIEAARLVRKYTEEAIIYGTQHFNQAGEELKTVDEILDCIKNEGYVEIRGGF